MVAGLGGPTSVATRWRCGGAAVGDTPNDNDMTIQALGRGRGSSAAAVGAGQTKKGWPDQLIDFKHQYRKHPSPVSFHQVDFPASHHKFKIHKSFGFCSRQIKSCFRKQVSISK